MEYRHVKFLPWVGEKYWEEKTRILVVGVKHYGGDPLAFSTHANIECVNSSLYNKNVEGFFDTFERTINVIRHEDETSEETWGRIAFCNYLQEVLATANSFPTAGQILNSQDAYIEILAHLKPHKVIMWGERLYNNVLCNKGHEAQNIDGRQTWMVDLHEWADEVETGHIVHSTYINDPSHPSFDDEKWRRGIQRFIDETATEHNNPQVKRMIEQMLRLRKVNYEDMVTRDGMDLALVLAKAVNNGILHFDPEHGIAEALHLKARNSTASSYFAHLLRKSMRKRSDASGDTTEMWNVLTELMDESRYEVKINSEGTGVEFVGKKRQSIKRLMERIHEVRRRRIATNVLQWDVLESLFDIRNMRQNIKDVSMEKEYAMEIRTFFKRKMWEEG